MTIDPITAIQSLGYTQREASFLYLVAVHSGYFLRRQFDYFIDRHRGGIVSRFLEKIRLNGHVQLLDSRHGRQVYHLLHKPIYRLTGDANSQSRRVKGDAEVRTRLMKLDYVLENDQDHYFPSDQDKLHLFTETRGIDSRIFATSCGTLYPEIHFTLISLADRTRPATSLLRCAFVDEGLLTTAKFRRILPVLAPLLASVGQFELIYVGTSDHNFEEAARIFWQQFSHGPQTQQQVLQQDWRLSPSNPVKTSARFDPKFVTLLLRFHYPPLARNELRCSAPCSALGSGESR
jgi:hypothetical protein